MATIFALITGWAITSGEGGAMIKMFAALAVIVFGLTAKTEHLIYITCYVLLAGSSSAPAIRDMSFYLRFGVLALFTVRLFPLFTMSAHNPQRPKIPFRMTPLHLGLLLYISFAFFSALYSVARFSTLQRSIALSILLIAVAVYLYWVSDSRERVHNFVSIFVRTSIALLMIGYLFTLAGMSSSQLSTSRLHLFTFGPNQLGYLCAILFPAAFWYYSEAKTKKQRWYAFAGAVLFVMTLLLTASRGSLLCFAMSGLLLVMLAYRRRIVMWSLGIIFIASLVYLVKPPDTDSLMATVEDRYIRSDTLQTGSGRWAVWREARHLIAQKPLIGYGYGTTQTMFERGYFAHVSHEFQGFYLHNGYLEILMNLGWMGMSFFLFAVISVVVQFLRLFMRTSGHRDQKFVATLFCCFVSGISSSMFESWLIAPGSIYSFPFWYCAFMLFRMDDVLDQEKAADNEQESEQVAVDHALTGKRAYVA